MGEETDPFASRMSRRMLLIDSETVSAEKNQTVQIEGYSCELCRTSSTSG